MQQQRDTVITARDKDLEKHSSSTPKLTETKAVETLRDELESVFGKN